jgi:hypothetical protein
MRRNICYIICTFLFLLSCKKEKIIDRMPTIKIDEVSNYFIVSTLEYPDTLQAQYNHSDELAIDLNNDGQNDINVVCWLFGSPGWGTDNGSYIEPLDNKTAILSFEKEDTVFYYHQQDTVYQQNFTEIFNSTVYENVNSHNSDSIYSITERSYPIFLKKDDEIGLDEKWGNQKLTFRTNGTGGSQYQQTNDNENHIIYYNSIVYSKHYGNWPIGEIYYLGVKYNDQLGWIKLKLESYDKIIVFEYALQK